MINGEAMALNRNQNLIRCCAIIPFTLSINCQAADITIVQSKITTINISGIIELGEYSRFMAVITASNPTKATVTLHSLGGKIDDAMKIGREIRAREWTTTVINTCQSACALIWVAGVTKYLPVRTSVGFHQPYLSETDKTVSIGGVARIGAYLNNLGYGDTTINFSVSEPPNRMRWIVNKADATAAGIIVNPEFADTIVPGGTGKLSTTNQSPAKAWPFRDP